jgi:hypothetical protein
MVLILSSAMNGTDSAIRQESPAPREHSQRFRAPDGSMSFLMYAILTIH